MRVSILAALMAATALIPAAASAENFNGERGDRGSFRQDRGDGGERRAPRVEQRRENPQPAPAPAPAPQAQPQQPRPQSFQGRTQGRGNWQGRPQFRQSEAQQPQPNRGAPGTSGAIRPQDARGRDWRGNGVNRPDIAPGGRGANVRGDGRGGNDNNWRGNRGGNDGRDGNWRGNRGGNDGRDGDWRGDRRGGDARNGNGNWRDNSRGYNDRNGRDYNDRRAWNRDWRRDGRYNWNDRRARDRNAFHLPRYYAPYGWSSGYRRFSIGFTLSSILFSQDYWLDDASYYGLPDAYGEYRWVRYYNDALLVDIYSGEVVDTVYDIFW